MNEKNKKVSGIVLFSYLVVLLQKPISNGIAHKIGCEDWF